MDTLDSDQFNAIAALLDDGQKLLNEWGDSHQPRREPDGISRWFARVKSYAARPASPLLSDAKEKYLYGCSMMDTGGASSQFRERVERYAQGLRDLREFVTEQLKPPAPVRNPVSKAEP